jgi:hypothetical protein
MTRWRQRIGSDAMELLLAETIAVAQKTGAVSERQLSRVTVDTTVQSSQGPWPQCGRESPGERLWRIRPTAICCCGRPKD